MPGWGQGQLTRPSAEAELRAPLCGGARVSGRGGPAPGRRRLDSVVNELSAFGRRTGRGRVQPNSARIPRETSCSSSILCGQVMTLAWSLYEKGGLSVGVVALRHHVVAVESHASRLAD
jgi:hypothetical protein